MTNALYTLEQQVFVLDNTDRRYILKFRDRNPEEKPRERHLAHNQIS
jgi:hypothetical protein